MTINNAVLKNCLKLSSKITVYVPATNGIDQAADNTEQVKKTAALLSELFGGATSTPALGYWMSPAAGLVAEATTVVSPTLRMRRSRSTSGAWWSCARS